MTKLIPGGRGSRYGSDSNVSYRESIDERVGRIPNTGTWIFSNLSCSPSSVTCVADRLVLYPCDIIERRCLVYEARASVDAAVASAFLKCAIYVFRGRIDGFFKVPRSDAELSCSSAGSVREELEEDVALDVGSRYFIGTCASNAGVSFVGDISPNEYSVSPLYIEHSSALDLPASIRTDLLIEGPTLGIPVVNYVSREAAEVM